MKKILATFCSIVAAFFAINATSQTIPDQIDAILTRSAVSANTWSVLVENTNGSVIYYQRNPTTGLAPASNTKMFTTSAAFGLLGTNYAFKSRVYYAGTLAGGVLTGNLNLVSEHDITWNTSVFSSARTPLDHIASQLKALGLTAINGNVQCYGLCAYNFASTDDLSASSTTTINMNAAAAFIAALQAAGITVSGSAVGQTGFTPPGTLYYTHNSSDLTYNGKPLRLDIACIPMLKPSHNVMADGLCRHLGWKLGTGDSYAVGAVQILRWVTNGAGLSTNGMVMNDGSGLSHGNRFSARQIVSLTRYMLSAFPSWDDGLPIGCSDGTLASRFCSTDGSKQVHAKTGSLSISIGLSGYISNKYDNQWYLFSFVANNNSGIDQTSTRQAMDDAVVLLGARGVPISPRLTTVTSQPNGTSIKVSWSDEKFVRTGYKLYMSSDGITFSSPVSLASSIQNYTESGLITGAKRYYKVSVVGTGGESRPSKIYGAQAGSAAKVLIVDGDDRWQFQTTENPTCTNHSFSAIAGQNISGVVFDTADHNAVVNGIVALGNYPAVVWQLGEESTQDETFSSVEQSLVATYLNSGGNLFISGSEIGWDLDRSSGPTQAARDFYHNQLRAVFANDDANTYAFAAGAGGIFSGDASGSFDNGTHGTYNVDFPDVLTSTNGSVAAITYTGGTGGAAAVQYDGSLGGGKVMNWGFPFETITSSTLRDAYMSDVLRFFGILPSPALAPLQYNPATKTLTLSWSASAGLSYRIQYKTNLTDVTWQALTPDITATNTVAYKSDSAVDQQRFYRVLLVN
jgi:D-alanyl-D-alanine carboxypeptidase